MTDTSSSTSERNRSAIVASGCAAARRSTISGTRSRRRPSPRRRASWTKLRATHAFEERAGLVRVRRLEEKLRHLLAIRVTGGAHVLDGGLNVVLRPTVRDARPKLEPKR